MTWFYGPRSLVIICNGKWHKMIANLVFYIVLKTQFWYSEIDMGS